ncbi:hypothetical protein M5K25_004468 [Dendrobium thyrsiflorum]|uniref:Uncharacterized protein n=1 Tax=Dendrobium thyrsiflorum TaxID=117978 RepID=A0ABD0VTP9_DENTH
MQIQHQLITASRFPLASQEMLQTITFELMVKTMEISLLTDLQPKSMQLQAAVPLLAISSVMEPSDFSWTMQIRTRVVILCCELMNQNLRRRTLKFLADYLFFFLFPFTFGSVV